MSDSDRPNIRRTHRGLRVNRAIARRGILFLTETSEDEIQIDEVDPQSGAIIEGSRLSRQAYTDDQAIRVYLKTRRRSRRESR